VLYRLVCSIDFLDGYCSTVQGLLDWFEVDLGFAKLLFIQTDLRVLCVFGVVYEWCSARTSGSSLNSGSTAHTHELSLFVFSFSF